VQSRLFNFVWCTKEVRNSPYEQVLGAFTQKLRAAGCAQHTINTHLRSALGVLALANRLGTKVGELDEKWLEGFARSLRQCRRPSYNRDYQLTLRHGAQLFLDFLRNIGLVITTKTTAPTTGSSTADGLWSMDEAAAGSEHRDRIHLQRSDSRLA
jgi:hypothetical protein